MPNEKQCQGCKHWRNVTPDGDVGDCVEGPTHIETEYDHTCGRFDAEENPIPAGYQKWSATSAGAYEYLYHCQRARSAILREDGWFVPEERKPGEMPSSSVRFYASSEGQAKSIKKMDFLGTIKIVHQYRGVTETVSKREIDASHAGASEAPEERMSEEFIRRETEIGLVSHFMGHDVGRLDRESLIAVVSYMGRQITLLSGMKMFGV